MARRNTIPNDIRAAALADLHGGEQPAVVAERYGVDPATVRSWRARYVATENATETAIPATVQRPQLDQRKTAIGEAVIDLLRAKLKASEAIAQAVIRDPEWIKRQSGSELAALGGWLDNTAFAIGDRLARRSEPDDATDDASD